MRRVVAVKSVVVALFVFAFVKVTIIFVSMIVEVRGRKEDDIVLETWMFYFAFYLLFFSLLQISSFLRPIAYPT